MTSPAMKLGRYEKLVPIAAGGMASVWAARLRGPAGFSKIVAIKAMLPELAEHDDFRTMFLDEARVASRLRHPNICETFDIGDENGELFLAMEWIEGAALSRVLSKSKEPLDLALAARILADACAGLHAAHEATEEDGQPLAVVHRDVSPQNILLSIDGSVKVADFGIAQARGKQHATQTGQAKGKLAYMAPEQLRAKTAVDRRVDVFALGAVLYEVTTGKKPFDGPTDIERMRAILERAPTAPSEHRSGYPLELERIVLRALNKDPDARFATAEGMRIALDRFLAAQARLPTTRDIGNLVRERCGDEIAEHRAQIQAACASRDLLPSAPPPAAPVVVTTLTASAAAPKANRWAPAAAVAAMLLAAAGGAFALGLFPGEVPPTPAIVSVLPSATASDAPSASTAPPAMPADAAAPEPTIDAGPTVTFHLTPEDAVVVVDGMPLGSAVLPLPGADGMRVVLVKAPGFADRLLVVDAHSPPVIDVALDPVADATVDAQ